MNPKKEKINFYFNKNIWSDIAEMSASDLRDLQDLINPLKDQLKIEIYYSPIGVLELIKGMKLEEHYQKCQEEIRLADRVSGQYILEDPWTHVRRSAHWLHGQPAKNPETHFLNLCRDIAILSYLEIKPRVQPIHDLLDKWLGGWSNELNFIKLHFKNTESPAAEFRNAEWSVKRKQRFWISFCDHYSLPSRLKELPFIIAYNEFHSFRYWVEYRLAYENKLFFENKNPKPSDYFDWQQTVYLNIMDYLVTNDKKLKSILKESNNEELHRVAISLNEFIDCLRGTLPPKRAPDNCSEQWYDAR
jgi:hypothetical protein